MNNLHPRAVLMSARIADNIIKGARQAIKEHVNRR